MMAMNDVVQLTRDYETRRTRAVPRHTLFGTTLELRSRQDVEGMKDVDLKELRNKEQLGRSDYQLPEHLRGSLTEEREKLTSLQRRLHEQEERACDASRGLKSLEEMYKYFKVDDVSGSLGYSAERPEDLRTTSDPVNQMSNGRSIGRRYGLQSSVTQPFHMNDHDLQTPVSLNPVTSYGVGRREQISDNALRRDKGSPRTMPRRTYLDHDIDANDKLVELPESLMDNYGRCLPANIQHKFGTRFCQSIFSDPSLVEQAAPHTRTGTRSEGGGSNRLQKDHHPRPAANYHSLGHLLRYNLGHTYDRQYDKGVTHSDFNSSVHARSYPTTDQHRYRKDDLNKWSEQDVIRSRTTKVWDERQAEMKDARAGRV